MDCHKNADQRIVDYCPRCTLFIRFSSELFNEVFHYISNGGDIDLIETIDSEIFFPICRKACVNLAMDLCEGSIKQEIDDFDPDNALNLLISNLPIEISDRKIFAERHSGYAAIQIMREPLFRPLILNIVETFD